MNTPPRSLSQHAFVKAVAQALRNRCGVRGVRGERGSTKKIASSQTHRLLVAVSGGADSVALLRALLTLATRRGWKLQLAVGHVQHHLRDDAENDATFVKALAEKFSLPHFRADLNLREYASDENVEAAARAARYAALLGMAREFGAQKIVTAHHGDDQMETMLMRLLRGSSVRGLAAMRWRRRMRDEVVESAKPISKSQSQTEIELIRPMLGVDHAAAKRFLREIDQSWCEDHTNADDARFRAKLRMQVLPVLRELRADLPACAAAWSDHLRGVSRLLEAQITQAMQQHVTKQNENETQQWSMSRTAARALDREVLMGLLQKMLLGAGVENQRLTRRMLSEMARSLRDRTGGKRTFTLQNGVKVVISQQNLHILSARSF